MTAQLIINGKEADFEAFMVNVVSRAVTTALEAVKPTAPASDFVIDPEKIYNLKDKQVHQLFGVAANRRPIVIITRKLRKYGIEPITKQRTGTIVFGSQILDYMRALKAEQTNYLKAN